MKFSTPAELFKLFGDIMVVIQATDRICYDLKPFVDELETNPTVATLTKIGRKVDCLREELMSKWEVLQTYQVVKCSLADTLTAHLEQQPESFGHLFKRYFDLSTTIWTAENAALKAQGDDLTREYQLLRDEKKRLQVEVKERRAEAARLTKEVDEQECKLAQRRKRKAPITSVTKSKFNDAPNAKRKNTRP